MAAYESIQDLSTFYYFHRRVLLFTLIFETSLKPFIGSNSILSLFVVISDLSGCKIQKHLFADVLQNKFSQKCCKFHMKASVLESLFIKVTGLKASNFIKQKLQHRCFLEIWEISKNIFYYKTPLVGTSENLIFC